MLETTHLEFDAGLLVDWQGRVDLARAHLGWEPALPLVARRHAAGASLAIASPMDQLFAATEVNEWALCASVRSRDPDRWRELEPALQAAAMDQAADPAAVDPPVLEVQAALARLRRLADAERRPDLLALVAEAAAHGVRHIVDEDQLTLGAGAGSRGWLLEALPASDAVPWPQLRDIPVAAVTGSNGKTTTVRLVAACARAHGWRDGFCCTDGVYVANALDDAGDYSGPAGTRRVLRDTRLEAAVLEMARGGILRRGLAIDRADVAVVTNVSNDHFGEYGIDDLDGLADAKLTVAHLVARRGMLVLNADDDVLRRKAASLPERLGGAVPVLGWFALDCEREEQREHRKRDGATAGVRDGRLHLTWQRCEHDLGAVDAMPLTLQGRARYNVANLAGAALAAAALGIPPATIAEVFARFGRDPADNPGRLVRFAVGGAQVLVDYAHNPDGLRGVLQVARALRGPGGRLIVLLGHAGNRRDEDLVEVAQVAASFGPGLVVVKEDEAHLRGRRPGEVPELLRRALLDAGLSPATVTLRMTELEAARCALQAAGPGDAVALLVHSGAAREAVLALLRDPAGR